MTGYTPAQRAAYSARIRAYEHSDTWRNRARRYRAHFGNTCIACGASPVDVHHVTYANAFNGCEPDEDLRPLCRTDHDAVHDLAAQPGWNLIDATAQIIDTRRAETRHDTTLPRSYAYDPRIWDAYTRNHPAITRYTPTRQQPRRRHHRKNTLAWFVAALIWAPLLLAIISGWR